MVYGAGLAGNDAMISIRKFLNADQRNEAAEPEPVSQVSEDLCRLSSRILASVNQFVLTGDSNAALRSRLIQVKDALRPDVGADEASLAAESVSSILAAHHASSQRAVAEQLVEAQHIFAMLNQALVVLSEGSDRDVSRLGAIQELLQRTGTMRDMASLKASLSNAVQFVKAESAKAREQAAQELGKFEIEVTNAREFLGGARLELAGRPEGVSEISDSLKSLETGEAVYLVAYLCDRLNAIVQRYGPGVADELLSRLIRERLKPVMLGNTMYRWTPSSLVAVFRRPRDADKLRNEVAELNRTPLVHKMALSGRTAVLNISPSHLIAEGVSNDPALLIKQVDIFTQAVA
jgi:hypothetical protein